MNDSKKRFIDFIETFNFIGKRIKINEAISISRNNFDRHFTSFSNFEFVIVNAGIRFSGAKVFFSGENSNYEIRFDLIAEFGEMESNEFQLVEILSENVYRKSVFIFI
ncbi:hypothetical protein L1276_001846 [Flavobacterium sp. HSC-32F16]|uniref:hypothetical protein n=1 Tax=Flavobacterium sp. HSC-32F16 TaxID=2910964 RepID=UPI0020A25ED0|nr:hypothetical protein [Flavobacterium sp. HSC-32F16]MCP2026702.1 hypothetical protein [Flavobacterium sp. HSC-32F16]